MSTWWSANGGFADWFHSVGGHAADGARGERRGAQVRSSSTTTPCTDVQWGASGRLRPPVVGVDVRCRAIRCRPDSKIAVVFAVSDHLDLFTTDSLGRTMSTWWDTGRGFAPLVPGRRRRRRHPVRTSPLSRGDRDHLDLFVIGTDTGVYAHVEAR